MSNKRFVIEKLHALNCVYVFLCFQIQYKLQKEWKKCVFGKSNIEKSFAIWMSWPAVAVIVVCQYFF